MRFAESDRSDMTGAEPAKRRVLCLIDAEPPIDENRGPVAVGLLCR